MLQFVTNHRKENKQPAFSFTSRTWFKTKFEQLARIFMADSVACLQFRIKEFLDGYPRMFLESKAPDCCEPKTSGNPSTLAQQKKRYPHEEDTVCPTIVS